MATTLLRPSPAPDSKWNTLQILKVSRFGLLALDGLLLIVAITGADLHRAAVKTVGKDAAPSIIGAQHIKSAMADMDSHAAAQMLGESGKMTEAAKVYDAKRVEAAEALIEAAENISFGDKERKPLQTLQLNLGTFERKIQRALDLHERGDAAHLDTYREASQVMDDTLLPAADTLDAANHDVLEATYSVHETESSGSRALLFFVDLILMGGLVWLQVFLSRRMHRTFNGLLLGATFATLAFLTYTSGGMGVEQNQLKIAKEDAFTSIHALWKARAAAYSANSQEIRYLLDRPNATQHAQRFNSLALSIAKLPPGKTLQTVRNAIQSEIRVENFSGYLADAANNITFPGEKEAVIQALMRFEDYLAVDAQMRRLEQDGKHKDAVDLCLGAQKGQATWAFLEFDDALGKIIDINQSTFDASVEQGFVALQSMEKRSSIYAVVIALLIFFGLRPRIREYE